MRRHELPKPVPTPPIIITPAWVCATAENTPERKQGQRRGNGDRYNVPAGSVRNWDRTVSLDKRKRRAAENVICLPSELVPVKTLIVTGKPEVVDAAGTVFAENHMFAVVLDIKLRVSAAKSVIIASRAVIWESPTARGTGRLRIAVAR